MESTVFKNYFETSFIKQLPEHRPFSVIYDGHATHVKWQRKNVGVKIPKRIFSKLIGEIWTETKPEIINGFVKAPINRNVVPLELFDPTALQRWNCSQAQKIADESLPSTFSAEDIDHQMVSSTSSAQDNDQMPTSTSRMHNDCQIPPDLSLDQNSVILNQDQESSTGAPAMVNVQLQDDLHKTGASFQELLLKFIKRDQILSVTICFCFPRLFISK
ncbi:hypothetical protein QE152_g34792 [Popillia japonica]|uniref:Transposase n=1 Tax=Popillia japonica TaxID=7064 RepID=A0AAW1IT62_POPJA